MSATKFVPLGWTRGERLVVEKRAIGHRKQWIISQPISYYRCEKDTQKDAAAFVWFSTWEEFAEFMQWWHEGR